MTQKVKNWNIVSEHIWTKNLGSSSQDIKNNAMINTEHSEDPYWNKKAKSIILYSTYLHIFQYDRVNLLPVEHI